MFSSQYRYNNIREPGVFTEGVLGPIIEMTESLFALMPISILFFLFIFFKFKQERGKLGIIKGLVSV